VATYGPQQIVSTGLAATYNAAAGGGDLVPPGCILHIKNTNAAILTVTVAIASSNDPDGLVVPDRTVTVPATTGERFWRALPYDLYRDPTDGLVHITWSVTAGVSFAVLS